MGAFDGFPEIIATAFEDAGIGQLVTYARNTSTDTADNGEDIVGDGSATTYTVRAKYAKHRKQVTRGGQAYNIVAKWLLPAANISIEPRPGDTVTRGSETVTVALVDTDDGDGVPALYTLLCEAG